MKNIIVVDIDTERTPTVQIGKTEASSLPKNEQEAKEMIITDMACLSEALVTLIRTADNSGYKTIRESLNDCITHLERSFEDNAEEVDNSEEE